MPRIIMALGGYVTHLFRNWPKISNEHSHCAAIMIIINGDVNTNYMLFSEQLFCVKYNFFLNNFFLPHHKNYIFFEWLKMSEVDDDDEIMQVIYFFLS